MTKQGTNRKRKASDPHPWRTRECPTKKLGFPSGEEAKLYAKMASSRSLDLVAYDCRECTRWHVATNRFGQKQEE